MISIDNNLFKQILIIYILPISDDLGDCWLSGKVFTRNCSTSLKTDTAEVCSLTGLQQLSAVMTQQAAEDCMTA